jgi:hypothetical protein
MIVIYIYLAMFAITLSLVLCTYRGNWKKYGGFWTVLFDNLLLAALWPALLPTGLLLMYKDRQRKKSENKE